MTDETALEPMDQRTISFYGDELTAVKVVVGGVEQIYAPLKPLCERLGIDWNGQYQRVKRDEILSEGMCVIHIPSPGGEQETMCLPIDMIHGWLFGVDVNRIREENRTTLLIYKRECYRALFRSFVGEQVAGALDPRMLALEQRIAALEQRQARRQAAISTSTSEKRQAIIVAMQEARDDGLPFLSVRMLFERLPENVRTTPDSLGRMMRRMVEAGQLERVERMYKLAE